MVKRKLPFPCSLLELVGDRPPLRTFGRFDIDHDGQFEDTDANVIEAMVAAWGGTGGPQDINGDGIVNVLDLLEVLGAWGPCP